MNEENRIKLRALIKPLKQILEEMGQVSEEMTAAYEAMPEGAKESDNGEYLRDVIVDLEISQTHLTDIKEIIENATSQ